MNQLIAIFYRNLSVTTDTSRPVHSGLVAAGHVWSGHAERGHVGDPVVAGHQWSNHVQTGHAGGS